MQQKRKLIIMCGAPRGQLLDHATILQPASMSPRHSLNLPCSYKFAQAARIKGTSMDD
jgi:hypothetical protein